MQLSIIIVSYNTAALTVETVNSIREAIGPGSSLHDNYEIIVVDNDSHDDTIARLKKLPCRHLKIINSGGNIGFGRANNRGVQAATGQFLLFLNSDTIVPAGSLETLVDFYAQRYAQERDRRRRLGLLAASLRNPDGTIQPQGGDLPNLFTLAATMFFLDDIPLIGKFIPSVQHTGQRFDPRQIQDRDFQKLGWVGGTAVMCQRDIWTEYGGWDEAIFMYGEDQELCYRLHQQHFYHGILHTAPITHLGSASSSSTFALLGEIRGYLYFFHRHASTTQYDAARMILWLACWLRVSVFTFIRPDEKKAEAYTQAISIIEKGVTHD